jgi:hypothetical protein
VGNSTAQSTEYQSGPDDRYREYRICSFPSGLPGQPILQRLLPNVCSAL